jgi:TPR repeat protein
MATSVRRIDVARNATVRICNGEGHHWGQGLLLMLESEGTVVLTCHHVISRLAPDTLHIALRQAGGGLGAPIPARYDPERSRPECDAVVLRVEGIVQTDRPLLHALNPERYSGTLPDRATAIGYWKEGPFDGRIGFATNLEVDAPASGNWPDPPAQYKLPHLFRFTDPTDARQGVSGSVVVYDEGVLGLVHFSREGGKDFQAEAYIVPLSVWADGWPELQQLIEPLIDRELRAAATIKPARTLEIERDILISKRGFAPAYIEREALVKARKLLAQPRPILVVGRPMSGKSRLALELLKERDSVLVVIPRGDELPARFETAGIAGRRLALFFDDLQMRSFSTFNPLEWHRRLEEASGEPCLFICTSRDGDDLKRVKDQPRLKALLDHIGTDGIVFTSDTIGGGQDLTPEEGLALAMKLGLRREEFEERFDGTPGSLTLDLAEMRRRYERLHDTLFGTLPMSHFLYAAKMLYSADQPILRLSYIRWVVEQVLNEAPLSPEAWKRLIAATEAEGFGHVDSANDLFLTYRPYLEQCVFSVDRQDNELSLEEILRIKDLLLEREDFLGLTFLGYALGTRYAALDEAEAILDDIGSRGFEYAFFALGALLSAFPERSSDAESAYRKAVDAGYVGAMNDLAVLLSKQPGGEKEAVKLYRRAVAAGDVDAMYNLALLLGKQPDREQEAEKLYRSAVATGHVRAMYNLALLLSKQPDREQEAEKLYRSAVAAGDVRAMYNLANLLYKQPGGEKEAEQLYRTVIDAGHVDAMYNLAVLLSEQPGREEDAKAFARLAISHGKLSGYLILAFLLANQPERLDEAKTVLETARQLRVEIPQWLEDQVFGSGEPSEP